SAAKRFPLLSITISCTYSNPVVDGRRFQVVPPSVLLNIPPPLTASIFNQPSPVAANIVSGCNWSCTIAEIARLGRKSFTGLQVGVPEVKLVVLKIPPLTEPAKTVLPD